MTPIKIMALAAAVSSEQCFHQASDFEPEDVLCLAVSRGQLPDPDAEPEAESDRDDPCIGAASEFTADGVSVADVTIGFPGGSSPGVAVVVNTSLGVLDPNGATDEEKRRRTLMTSGRGPLELPLYAGLESGTAIVTASLGNVSVERRVRLAPSSPTSLSLSANNHILAQGGALASDLTALLFVTGEKRRPSIGVDVAFLACEGTSASNKVELPPMVRTKADGDRVGVTLGLNAAGLAVLNELAMPDVVVTIHAYVPDESPQRCDALDPAAPQDSLELRLRRKTM